MNSTIHPRLGSAAVYPVYPELRGEPRRACSPSAEPKGHRFSPCPTPFTLFTPSFEGSAEGPPSPPNLYALSVSAFNSSLFFGSGMDREQTPFDIRPEAELFRINTCRSASKQTALTAFRINTSWGRPHFALFWCNLTLFRINTCKSVSKQTTLTSFRMNTYEKTGGWGVPPLVVQTGHIPDRLDREDS